MSLQTDTQELQDIWKKAVENFEENAEHYIGDSGEKQIKVNGVDIIVGLDMDNAIYYSISSGGVDDLVYAKENTTTGSTTGNEVLQTEDEFISRVKQITMEWRDKYI